MAEPPRRGPHRALLLLTPTAAAREVSGAQLRAAEVRAVLEQAGYHVTTLRRGDPPLAGPWCVAVASSYVNAPFLRTLSTASSRTWLDAVDSWLLMNLSGLRAGRPSYLLRAARDAVGLARMPTPDLATWTSGADLQRDGGTVRAKLRLVLPGRQPVLPVAAGTPVRRVVLAGDWSYGPNRDGLSWFVERVAPLAGVPVHVFGRGLADVSLPSGLTAHGYVDDDGLLHRPGDIHVAPLRFGAGVKRKVVQPLLAGLSVVTTTTGAHGLQSHPLLTVHDEPARFAAALRILYDAEPVRPAPPPRGQVLDRDDTGAIVRWLQSCHAAH